MPSLEGAALVSALRPESFAHPVTAIEVRETHVSWVVLTDEFAYKLKKPVRFPFLDASTLERRRQLCEEELRLNRRLAPELYLGVVPVTGSATAPRFGGDGPVVDYAVQMRRFSAEEELPALLQRGAVHGADLAAFGRALAAFHRAAPRTPPAALAPFATRLAAALNGTFAALARAGPAAHAVARLDHWCAASLQRLRAVIDAREAGGAVRECHGDLHAGNVVRWRRRLTAFDCLEFDPGLRWIDVMADVAFLYMDLIAHERRDLAIAMLDPYLEETGDYGGLRCLSLYAVQRACVRASIDALGAESVPQASAAYRRRMWGRLATAGRLAAPVTPSLILMFGASGSGKSWLSERLGPALGAVRIRSDRERKRIAGLAATARVGTAAGVALYSDAHSERTYARLAACTLDALAGGLTVIVDAAFREPARRRDFAALAARAGAPLLIVECRAAPAVLLERLAARERDNRDPSDAGAEVLAQQLARPAELDATEQLHAVRVDTTELAPSTAIEMVRARLEAAQAPG